MELSKKLFDLSSEIRVYADKDLKERHRPHKKQFHQTAEATDKIQEGYIYGYIKVFSGGHVCILRKHIAQNLTKQRENRARLESSSGSGQKFEKRIEKSKVYTAELNSNWWIPNRKSVKFFIFEKN